MEDYAENIETVKTYKHKLEKYSLLRENEKVTSYLRKLKNFPVTLEILQETGVGKTVNNLRKYGGHIGDKARDLVNKWKALVLVDEDEPRPSPQRPNEEEEEDDDEDEDDAEPNMQIDESAPDLEPQPEPREPDPEPEPEKPEEEPIPSPAKSEPEPDVDPPSHEEKPKKRKKKSKDKDKESKKSKKKRRLEDEKPVVEKKLVDCDLFSGNIPDPKPSKLKLPDNLLLPEISPNYVPQRAPPPPDTPSVSQTNGIKRPDKPLASHLAEMSEHEALNWAMSAKTKKTKVYSGIAKGNSGVVPKLEALCLKVLGDHVNSLHKLPTIYVMPYLLIKPILFKCNPDQLLHLEDLNPHWIEDTDEQWELLAKREFKSETKENYESWREMYMRCKDERDIKLRRLTASISRNVKTDKSSLKKTKLAYVDVPTKPAQRKVKLGESSLSTLKSSSSTLSSSSSSSSSSKVDMASAANRANILSTAVGPNSGTNVAVPAVGRASNGGGSSRAPAAPKKPKPAPLMVKSLKLMKNRYR
ncbi:unnamed protein product [Notodromas monacha]|uniref:TFIIS N-terminal domain-containing protein n=1 Tax=Notodromas monacha TaxID=399045 RepID=A0A7R9G9T6_9CRUS|nr:unnamed protein product [Notodromas monacha]CAG0913288.1 unnamed protein product [Notodromas monacha]